MAAHSRRGDVVELWIAPLLNVPESTPIAVPDGIVECRGSARRAFLPLIRLAEKVSPAR
jgi:hypothetical protein